MLIQDIYPLFLECSSVCTDTRKIEKDALFFALKGPNFNANSFAESALVNGCKYAIIDEKEYYIDERTILVEDGLVCLQELAKFHRDQLKIPLIGITGSNGKTTNKELIHAVLSQKYQTSATQGNLNNHIGVPLSILSISAETEIAIIEMGANHAGEIEFLCSISKPTYGLLTNIGKAHLEGFGNLETTIETKTALYRSVKKSKGIAFVNANDKLLMEKSEGLNRVLFPSENTVSALLQASTSPFLEFDTYIKGVKKGLIKTKLIGAYNLDNALAAMVIGNYFDVNFDQIKTALESYNPSNNRSQWMESGKNKLILDAYNANPNSTLLAIENFHELSSDRKLIILGDMLEIGSEELFEHQKIVDVLLKQNVDVILVGPIYSKCKLNHRIKSFKSTDDASAFLTEKEFSGRTILLKGSRGLKLERLVEYL